MHVKDLASPTDKDSQVAVGQGVIDFPALFRTLIEIGYRQGYVIDNANLLKIPGYTLVNLNIHYAPPAGDGWLSRMSFYASVQNLFDRTYAGSASVIADSLNAGTGIPNGAAALQAVTGSIYAGTPRTVYAGVKARF